VQSILKRVPVIISPLLGGALMAALGIAAGMRMALAITLVMAAITLMIVLTIDVPGTIGSATNMRGVWRSFDMALKRLLVSDIIIRTCEGMAGVFIILHVTNVTGINLAQYGILVAIQVTTSILIYIPAAKIADRIGRKPFVIATFICFALFPIAIVLASGFAALVVAFVIGGLREIGEPSRKAMIVDFAEPHVRARTVGLYYLVRSLAVTPAAAIGGLLWKIAPGVPFFAAGIIGILGTLVFVATVEERYAS
jgi:MFS family permease